MLLLLLGGLAFVFPVAIYCVVLALLNRRRHPVMVHGSWDFAEVLFACAGFLFFGGPAMITGFNPRWRDYWIRGRPASLYGLSADWWMYWISVLVLYFGLMLAAAIYLLWRRRLTTAIYNIDPRVLEECLIQVLEQQGVSWERGEQGYFLAFRRTDEVASSTSEMRRSSAGPAQALTEGGEPVETAAPQQSRTDGPVMLELSIAPALRHVTLSWPADARVRREAIEDGLAAILSEVETCDNPVSWWMIGAALLLFIISALFMLLFLLMVMRRW